MTLFQPASEFVSYLSFGFEIRLIKIFYFGLFYSCFISYILMYRRMKYFVAYFSCLVLYGAILMPLFSVKEWKMRHLLQRTRNRREVMRERRGNFQNRKRRKEQSPVYTNIQQMTSMIFFMLPIFITSFTLISVISFTHSDFFVSLCFLLFC